MQPPNPGLVFGQVPTAAQWNAFFAACAAEALSNATYTAPGGVSQSALVKFANLTAISDYTTVQEASTQANSAGTPLFWPEGTATTTSNIPFLSLNQNVGAGAITDGVSVFHPACPFGVTNTIFVSPAGDDVNNDGISSSRSLLTVNEAIRRISLFGGASSWVIQLAAGMYTASTVPVVVNLPQAFRVVIQGATPLTTTLAAVTSVTGTDGAYVVTAQVGSTAQMTAGQYIGISAVSGLLYGELFTGMWKIASVVDGTHITFNTTTWYGAPPTGSIAGTITIFQTHLFFNSSYGFVMQAGYLKNLAIIGNQAGSGFGVIANAPNPGQQIGHAFLDGAIGVNGFHDDGIRADASVLTALPTSTIFSSNNGDNGSQGRKSGGTVEYFGGFYASGNGWLQIPSSGGNGLMGQLCGHAYAFNAVVAGNWGMGLLGRTSGSVLIDSGGSFKSVGNDWNLKAGPGGGFVQAIPPGGALLEHGHSGDLYVEGKGVILANGLSSTNARGNAIQGDTGGYAVIISASITAPAVNAILAINTGTVIDATGVDVVSKGVGDTSYFAEKGAQVIATGPLGLTDVLADATPSANTLGGLGALVIE